MKEIAFGGYGDLKRRGAIGGSIFGEVSVVETVNAAARGPVRRYFDGVQRQFSVRQLLLGGSDTAKAKTAMLPEVSQQSTGCRLVDRTSVTVDHLHAVSAVSVGSPAGTFRSRS